MKEKSIILPLILIMFMATAIPSVVVITLNNYSVRESSEQAIAESAQDALAANQKYCDELFTQYIYTAMDFILDRHYARLDNILTYRELTSNYENVMQALDMSESLQYFVDRNRMIHSSFFYIDGADYVVATNGGIVTLDTYEDIDWLQEILEQESMPGGYWYTRSLGKENLLSYVYRSNSLYTASRVTVVINVYEEDMSKLVYDQELENGAGYLVDGEGRIIVHSDEQYLYQDISNEISEILEAQESQGIIEKGGRVYIYQKSQLYDWIYINDYDSEQIFHDSFEVFQLGLILTLIVIFLGVLLAVFCAWRIYQPVRKLVNEMKDMNLAEGLEESKNEMTYLSNALTQIKEREQKLASHLVKNEESVRQKVIYELMQGEELHEEQMNMLERYFAYHHFIVCMILIDDEADYLANTNHEERKVIRSMVGQYMQEIFGASYHCDFVRYNQSAMGIVINFEDYDSARVSAEIREIMQRFQEYYREQTGYGCTIGISLVHNYVRGIYSCTQEAYQAAGRRLVEGKGRIHFATRSTEERIQTYEFYQNEKHIMNYLEIGDLDKISQELEMVVRNIRELKNISEDNIMLVFYQMIGDILIYMNRHNYNVNQILQERQNNLYAVLAQFETLDEIKEYLETIMGRILVFQAQEKQEEGNSDYSQQIIQYIKKYYQTDIDFEQMAEQIGISYSYARKIMKAGTGKSLIEYLSLVRIGEAKRLLEEGTLSMAEIAEQVGYHNVQSLYRFFKKHEGISPNTYREEVKKQDV